MTDTSGALLRGALIPAVCFAVVVSTFGGLWAGAAGLAGAAIGASIVVVFFSLTLLVMWLARRSSPETLLLVALGSFTAKIVVFGVALALFDGSAVAESVDRAWFAAGAIGCAAVWLLGEVIAFSRLRVPAYDIAEDGAP